MPWRGTARSSMTNAASRRSGPCLLRPGAARLDAGEVLLERADPAESGRDRVGLRADVVSVQRVADLEAQGVARSQSAGPRSALEHRIPERGRLVRHHEQLDPFLARVAGAVDHARDPRDLGPRRSVNAGAGSRPSRSSVRGPWTATRPYSSETSRTSEPRTSRSFSQAKSVVAVRRVHDQQEAERVELVGDQVVDDPSALVRQQRVLGAARLDPVEVVREQRLEQLARARPLDLQLRPCATRRTRRQSSRTARCSWITPSYCTGMSQPANGTIRAPRAT